jgi:hypothetical protein
VSQLGKGIRVSGLLGFRRVATSRPEVLVHGVCGGGIYAAPPVDEQGVLRLLDRLLDEGADRGRGAVPQLEPAIPVVVHGQRRLGTGSTLRLALRTGGIGADEARVGLGGCGPQTSCRVEGVSTHCPPQLRDRRVPGQLGHRRLVAGGYVVRNDGNGVEGHLAGPQGCCRVRMVGPSSRDHDDVAGVCG